MVTIGELNTARRAYRAEHGPQKTHDLINEHGGEGNALDSVPEENRDALFAAFGGEARPNEPDASASRYNISAKTPSEIRTALEDMNKGAFARFNAPPRRTE